MKEREFTHIASWDNMQRLVNNAVIHESMFDLETFQSTGIRDMGWKETPIIQGDNGVWQWRYVVPNGMSCLVTTTDSFDVVMTIAHTIQTQGRSSILN